MTASELARLLHGKRTGHGKYICKCPSHDDRSPSMSIKSGDKCVLIKCWSGCSNEDILSAIGLTFSDLFYSGTRPDPKALREAEAQKRKADALHKAARAKDREFWDAQREWETKRNSIGARLMADPNNTKLAALFGRACEWSRELC